MRKILTCTAPCLLAVLLAGCIKNDIPYPRQLGRITAFEVEGQKTAAVIDSTARTVTVDMLDTVDLAEVRLLRLTLSENTKGESLPDSGSILNMTADLKYTLTTWPDQSYEWTVRATQTIERYIKAENQVGEALIDAGNFTVKLPVAESVPLDQIVITEVRLGPSNSVITPDPREVHDFTQPQKFTVTYRDVTEEWTIVVMPTEVSVMTSEADAWARSAYLYGMVPAGMDAPGFRYRKSADSDWADVPSENVTVDGMNVSALLTGLEPGTSYVYRVYSGEMEGTEVGFTTEAEAQMPNMGFDEWIKDGKSWFANRNLEDSYWWDSGNIGANLIGEANPTSPEDSFLPDEGKGEGKRAARLETVKVAGIKMAGGNIFSGHFGSVDGMGAEVFFGRPFETRPLRLTGWYSYVPKSIDNVDPPSGVNLPFDRNTIAGRMDRCHIFVYVTAWDGPYRVNTTERRYLDINDPDVIGYGELIDSTGTGGEYRQFSIDIKYRDHRKPTYCAVVAVASQYADFFTGGIGSLMYVDEFAFGYDGTPVWEEDAQQ